MSIVPDKNVQGNKQTRTGLTSAEELDIDSEEASCKSNFFNLY